MTRNRDKPPAPIVRKTGGALSPVSAWDAELISAQPNGTEFDLIARTKRSNPQNALYWRTLAAVCEATGRWERPEALHMALKVQLGYVEPLMGLDGKIKGMVPDSTSFAAMTHADFRVFFDRAMAALAEATGVDPLSL
jgi:hypothetical protein